MKNGYDRHEYLDRNGNPAHGDLSVCGVAEMTRQDDEAFESSQHSSNDDRSQREIELAWLSHEPERNRIPTVVWRQLRAIKKEIEPTSVKINATLQNEEMLHLLIEQCCRRRGMARQRLLAAVRRSFSGAEVKVVHKNVLDISWLAPSPPVIASPKDHGERQACTLLCYCVAWPAPLGITVRSAWALEVPDHAAGRYLQRAGASADFKSALFEAASHFYAADTGAVMPHVGRGTSIHLPASGGCFVCTVVGAKSGTSSFLFARAATWVDGTMLRSDQTPLRQAEAAAQSVAALLLD